MLIGRDIISGHTEYRSGTIGVIRDDEVHLLVVVPEDMDVSLNCFGCPSRGSQHDKYLVPLGWVLCEVLHIFQDEAFAAVYDGTIEGKDIRL
jgi:hypothetical protein